MKHVKISTLKIVLLISALLVSQWVQAAYEAEAYGPSAKEARKNALAALSESMLVQVKSEFKSRVSSDGAADASQAIHTISELPLLGVEYSESKRSGEYHYLALLKPAKALPLYRVRLESLAVELEQLDIRQQSQSGDQRYKTLQQMLVNIAALEKYQLVASLLGDRAARVGGPNRAAVSSQLLSMEASVASLSIAATVLARDLADEVYLIQAPLPFGSSQPTKLSRMIQRELQQKVRSTDQINRATAYLRGSYEIASDGIVVSYQVTDPTGDPIASRIVKLAANAYANIPFQPESVNFDQLLHEGYVVSNEFRAEFTTNQGKSGLLFTSGQTIELLVKVSAPGYFYIVAHNAVESLSYLIELNDAPGKRLFVRYVNADDANRWLSLGEFEVTPPFGTENLQLIASSKDLIDRLPAYRYDVGKGLYLVQANSLSDAVSLTRGLKPKGNNEVRSTEATMTYTSME
jgi:hypothetical protein